MTTKPREWPENAKTARDQAAQELVKAQKHSSKISDLLIQLAQNGGSLTNDDKFSILTLIGSHNAAAITHQANALRWLESAGAPTKPPTI